MPTPRSDAARIEEALRAQVSAVRKRRVEAFETGSRWRTQHGHFHDDAVLEAPEQDRLTRYSSEPGRVSCVRRRYGQGWRNINLSLEARAAAERLVAMHEAHERLGKCEVCAMRDDWRV